MAFRVNKMLFATKRRREIEAKSVDVHFRYPIAKAIHNELQELGRFGCSGVLPHPV